MAANRRTFLKTTALSASRMLSSREFVLFTTTALSTAYAGTPTSTSAVLGLAGAYSLQDKDEQRDRTLRVIAHLARVQADVEAGNKSVSDAAKEIRDTADREKALDPATFGPLASYFQMNGDPASFWTTLAKSAVGGGLGAVSAWVTATEMLAGPPGWAIAGALAAAGVLAGPVIDDLGKTLLPAPDAQTLFGLTAWATSNFYASLTNSNFKDLTIDLRNSGLLALDPEKTPMQALDDLPPRVRDIIQPHIQAAAGGPGPAPTKVESDAAIRRAILDGFKELDDRANDILKKLEEEHNAAVRAMQEAAARRQLEYIAGELRGVGIIGDFVLTRIFGDATAGHAFGTFVSAGVTAYAALMSPGIGPIALAGQLVSAANQIFGLFSDTDPLNAVLAQISAKLGDIVSQLNVIEAQQVQILSDLQKIYTALLANQALLTNIQQQLTTFATSSAESFISSERQAYDINVGNFRSLLANNTADAIAADKNLLNDYGKCLSQCVTYASKTAADKVYADNGTGISGPAAWATEIVTRVRSDRLIGLLPLIASDLAIAVPVIPNAPAHVPANPTAWAEGANAYLAGRGAAPNVPLGDEEVNLQQLWLDGLFVRQLILNLTNPDAIKLASDRFFRALGVPDGSEWDTADLSASNTYLGEVYNGALQYDLQNVDRKITAIHQGPLGSGTYFLWGSNYIQPGGGPLIPQNVNFTPDYFGQLLSNKLIGQEDIQPAAIQPGAAGWVTCVYRITADGPKKGSFLTPDRIQVQPFGGNPAAKIFYPALGTIPVPTLFMHNPWQLQERARDVVLGQLSRPKVRNQLPSAIQTHMQPFAGKFPDVDYWGEVLRLLTSLVRWRAAGNESIELLLRSNCSGPFSTAELQAYITAYIKDHLSYAGDWPLEVCQGLVAAVRDSLEDVRAQSAKIPTSKAVATVDETLRRLHGFMTVRGITPENLA